MKIIRLQIPGNFLVHVGFAELFEELEFVEILNAFQYDQKRFFALQRIKFKEKVIKNLNQYIEELFSPESFQLLERRGNEIIGILDQKRSAGFFPIIDSGPWAFLFPIHVSSSVLLINVISRTEYVNNLFNMLTRLTQNNFKIIGMTNIDDMRNSGTDVWQSLIPFPKFTPKQEEIVKYAAKNGFFTSPKKISAKDISLKFEISESAVNKHLRKATNLAMDYFFGKYF
ncbi:MAG: helix-turn-helix domain-containing protein [Candidatus Hermodarchaeota archaeon]